MLLILSVSISLAKKISPANMIRSSILLILLFTLSLVHPLFAQIENGFNYYYQSGTRLMLVRDSAKQALAMFDTAVLLNPKSADAYVGRGAAKINYSMPVEGIKDYDTAILMADYKDKLRYFELKEDKLTEGKFIPLMTRLTVKSSGDFVGYGEMKLNGYNALNPSVGVKKFFPKEQIKQVYDSAVKLFPDSAIAYIDRANYFHKNKDFTSAIKDIKKAISLSSIPKYYILLACTMYNSGDYSDKKIEKVLNQCLKKNPKDWNSYNYRAMLFSFRNLPEKAIRDYDKAIEIYPNAASYFNRAEAKKGLPLKYSEQDIQSDYNNATLYKDR